MRHDMSKVVTEKPRRGSRTRSLKTGRRLHRSEFDADDHGATRHKVSRHGQYGWDAKEFTDVLNPLRRYLRKQVGRPWNAVYSELARTLDRRSLTGLHIWDHVRQEVEIHTEWRDGHAWCSPTYGCHYRVDSNNHYGDYALLYVHPLTGLLCAQPPGVLRYRRRVDPDVRQVDDTTNHERINGCWFEVRYGLTERYVPPRKLYAGSPRVRIIREGHFETDRVRIGQRQLNRKELKRHGLSNVKGVPSCPKSR